MGPPSIVRRGEQRGAEGSVFGPASAIYSALCACSSRCSSRRRTPSCPPPPPPPPPPIEKHPAEPQAPANILCPLFALKKKRLIDRLLGLRHDLRDVAQAQLRTHVHAQ